MDTAVLPPTTPPPASQQHIEAANAAMLSFGLRPSLNPFSSYDHPYSNIADYDESDFEPLLPERNPLRVQAQNPFQDPPLDSSSSTTIQSTQATSSDSSSSTPAPSTSTSPKTFRVAKHTHLYANPPAPNQPRSDEDIIPAIIVNVIPAYNNNNNPKAKSSLASSASPFSPSASRQPGFLRKLSSGAKRKDGNVLRKEADVEGKGILKVMYMPRKEYARYFARGLRGEYVGTEPERRWREEELEERFGRFKPVTLGRGRGRGRL